MTGRDGFGANRHIADRLLEAAALLHAQGASPYRVNAYRRAAEAISRYPRDLRRLYQAEGVRGLDSIPHVGLGIASAVAELLANGRWSMLDHLRGRGDPATVLQAVPGLGPRLARRIHEELRVDTLEQLEAAAHDGRLEALDGVGARRAAAFRASLESMLGRFRADARPGTNQLPPVATLLDVDREYRERADGGHLRLIAPKRFNPRGEAWLPVLHAQRGPWHFTALYSNTALAHRLGRTRDWVVLFYYDGDHVERQYTVVTETHGALAGRRVVRGREAECRAIIDAGERHELHADHAA
jgi:DNA polymerase (family 10)